MVENSAAAIDFYRRAFGAEEIGDRALGPDGRVMHAELRIGSSVFYLNDVMGGAKSAKSLGGSPIGLWLYVEDADAVWARALAAGATAAGGEMGRMQDQFWGDRCGTLIDPEGFYWTIATRKEDLSHDERQARFDAFLKNMMMGKS
jgi:PhnB protein